MTRSFRYILFLICALAVMTAFAPAANAQRVEIKVQPTSHNGKIAVGDKFYIYVIVKNSNAEPEPITSAGGAEVLYWTLQSSSSSFESNNGQVSRSSENVYAATLLAHKKGTYTIGPVIAGNAKSNVARYTIVDSGSASDNSGTGSADDYDSQSGGNSSQTNPSNNSGPTFIGKGNDQLFLRASVSKTNAYEQEALVYTVKLYTTYSTIKFIGATDAPKFEGFVIEESNNTSNQLTIEQYQGRSYATAIIARYIIFPQMPGQLKVIGNKYTVSTDANEYYHDPYFSTLTVRRPIQLNVTPNDLVVNVKALPTPRPANFSGGVGKFSISSSMPSKNVVANQAGSVTYIVSGEGNLKYIHLPDLNAIYPDEIEVFSPTTDVQTNVGVSNVSGSIKFDYSFMPLEMGKFKIPDVELVYFNPATGQYETTRAAGYTIDVAKGVESSKSQATLSFNSKLMKVDVDEQPMKRPYIRGFLYWLWFIIPALALTVIIILRRQYIAEHSDLIRLRSKQAGKMAKRRLKKAASAMKSGDENKFYDEILKAIWGYLSDKLRLPTSELTRDNVSQIMEAHSIDKNIIDKLLNLIDECEFAKYSPASSRKPMNEIYELTATMLNTLQEAFSKKPDPNSGAKPSAPGNSATVAGIIALLIVSAFSYLGAYSSTNASLVAEADSAYASGKYDKAIELYNQAISQQGATAPALFNLACAYYKSGNEGEARLCLERAKRIDPSNSQINQNIQYIENRVEDANKAELKGKKGDVAPDNIGFFGRVKRKIAVDTSSNSWASFAVMSFILLILAIAGYLFSPEVKFKKIGFFSGLIFLGFTIIFLIFSEMSASRFEAKDEAVVTSFKVSLLKDPHNENDLSGSTLCRGTKVQILESQLNADGKIGWYKVRLNSSNIGWVEASEITII